jgi:hypothetical protein
MRCMHRRDVVCLEQVHGRAGYLGSSGAWYGRVSVTLTCPMMGLCHTLRKLQPFWIPLRFGETSWLPNADIETTSETKAPPTVRAK